MIADMPVVSNAGPLVVLSKLNLLYLLKELYGRVHISRSVYDEVVIAGMRQGYEDARTLCFFLEQMEWRPKDLEPTLIPAALREAHLDRGERDTLALAMTFWDALVLMDEALGREIARAQGLTVRGSPGVLIEAYQRDMIRSGQLRLYFATIARRRDIWINQALVERLLHKVLEDQF